jgi:hypothetical protein
VYCLRDWVVTRVTLKNYSFVRRFLCPMQEVRDGSYACAMFESLRVKPSLIRDMGLQKVACQKGVVGALMLTVVGGGISRTSWPL